MSCRYCAIKADRRDIREEEVYQAIELLLTSPHKEIELQFFGGEPLLRFDLIRKAVAYSQRRARSTNKKISYLLTTNGLLLDRKKLDYFKTLPLKILLSTDGTPATQRENRPLKRKNIYRSFRTPAEVIADLQKSKIDFFVNLVYSEKNLKDLPVNVAFLAHKGARKVQLSYAIGSRFKKKDARAVYSTLKGIFRAFTCIDFFGRRGEHEPILATPQITIDSNGEIYRGCALVLERKFPDLNKFFRIGSLKNIDSYSLLKRSQKEQVKFLLDHKKKIRPLFLNNLFFGLALKKLMSEGAR